MKPDDAPKTGSESAKTIPARQGSDAVLQVERHDYVDLAPTDRKRVQSMQGFDPIYTDIVDYIVRCTHRIWDERDVGLIYTHYTHNCVVYSALGTTYNREDVVRGTIQRLASLPERKGMATHVIWTGNDREGFYTSHLVQGSGRHNQPGQFGPATGRTFSARTIADCAIFENKIYREWLVQEMMGIVKQIGLDPQAYAENLAKGLFDKGILAMDIGENLHLLGQYPPEAEPETSIASTDLERQTLEWMHEVWNRRMFGKIRDVYAPNVQYHGPLSTELYGQAAVIHQTVGFMASLPDASFHPLHICSTPCEEGGTKVAVRWVMEGHHLGWGLLSELGAPSNKRVQVMGMSHFHYKNGKIVDEWRVYDEMSMLMQVKLAQMADRKSAAEALA